MGEALFAVELFRNIGDFMYAAADNLEGSDEPKTTAHKTFSQPMSLATDTGAIALDLTPHWKQIVSTLEYPWPNDLALVIALLRGIGDLVYAIADFLAGGSLLC